ncbi:hypothetical protein L1987_63733 [Smallanthus sonchifolius]|uniref:Uncharacterized protein n=1 Tax=Smallanthus sonchifolius TaxID=185202 RepID=A0ACB9CEC8_9ASTR|nr:hypothetical protein L1987_63733 [Smallanthus sonchifolius]
MPSSPSYGCIKKKHWWLTNKQIVDMYVKDARSLIASQEQSNIASAINLLDAALALSPRCETAMELKATCLLRLRRFKEVADMLQDYIPSLKMASDDTSSFTSSSDNNSQSLAREQVKLLSDGGELPTRSEQSVKCFSVSDLKKRVMAGLVKNRNKEGQWRYLILALTTRASLFESINCLPDSLHDLEHLKLLYNSILRDRKLPGPAWKRQTSPYHEIPEKLRLIQRGYTNLMRIVLDDEALEKQRKKLKLDEHEHQEQSSNSNSKSVEKKNAFQGVFCRDLAVVGSLLCQTGFNRPIQVKYEGLSC